MEEKLRVLEKAKMEIERFHYYLDNEIPIECIQRLRKFILNNKFLMKLYKLDRPIDLTAAYLKKVHELRKVLKSKDNYQYLANVLEYFRFMCMRDNIEGVIPGISFFENLSDSKFSALIINKASAEGQAAAIVDILSDNLDVSMCNIGYYKPGDYADILSNYACITIKDETGKHYVDPYRYYGKLVIDKNLINKNYVDDIYPLVLDTTPFRKAKKKVSTYLIKKLKIKEIIDSLNLSGLSETEMNDKFIEYIKNNQDNYEDIKVNANTIKVNGELLEVTRLLELFYIASGIRYRVINDKKENSTFEVILDEEKTIVSLDDTSNKKLIKQ